MARTKRSTNNRAAKSEGRARAPKKSATSSPASAAKIAAALRFGPSRQSVQQYANSPLRDARWRPYQQNRRKKSDG
ncbi:hypothetical protein L6R52_23335 [Myxococcota bacterium]|nr:hypothetical protein [Myxococcota bacterium]